jgi:hypothetical protein
MRLYPWMASRASGLPSVRCPRSGPPSLRYEWRRGTPSRTSTRGVQPVAAWNPRDSTTFGGRTVCGGPPPMLNTGPTSKHMLTIASWKAP